MGPAFPARAILLEKGKQIPLEKEEKESRSLYENMLWHSFLVWESLCFYLTRLDFI